jgi:hypothetical protein
MYYFTTVVCTSITSLRYPLHIPFTVISVPAVAAGGVAPSSSSQMTIDIGLPVSRCTFWTPHSFVTVDTGPLTCTTLPWYFALAAVSSAS